MLYANGDIRFNYQDIDSYPGYGGGIPDGDSTVYKTGGINATIGIWKGGSAPLDAVVLPAGVFVPGPHSVRGDTFDGGSGESNDSYVRMAWDTGGTAWDIGVVSQFGIGSEVSNALRDAFVGDLAAQINNAIAHGKVARADDVIAAYNLGDGAIPAEGFTADTPFAIGGTSTISTALPINTQSNSVPEVGSPAAKVHTVFQTARHSTVGDLNLSLPTLPNGAYAVELFFARILAGTNTPIVNVVVEGKTLLNDFNMLSGGDQGRIIQFVDPNTGPSQFELDVAPLNGVDSGMPTGVVKRFLVNVGDADGQAGLQIILDREVSTDPYLNGLRILRTEILGDYNRNGVFDAADYTVWRDTLGNSVTPYSGADGDGDGVITVNDYAIWKSGFGSATSSVLADFNHSGATDIADYFLWPSTYGSTTDLRADFNEDGIVDDADYQSGSTHTATRWRSRSSACFPACSTPMRRRPWLASRWD